MIKIEIVNKDMLFDIQEAAYTTIDKDVAIGDMSPDIFLKYIISEHSPIRTAILKVFLIDISVYTSVHFARHKFGIEHFVKSNRPDIKKGDRSVNDTVKHLFHGNLQSLINTARVRLCGRSEKPTIKETNEIKKTLLEHENEYLRMVGLVLVPNCVYRFGCPEFKTCKRFNQFKIDNIAIDNSNIIERYKAYKDYHILNIAEFD